MSNIFSSVFLWTLFIIFISAIIGAVISQRRRDRCLQLMDDYHVTLAMINGRVIWGDLRVFAHGIRIDYDAPYRTQQGLIKSGYLLYEPEMAKVLAVCRYVGHLTQDELRARDKQALSRFNPGPLRRTRRAVGNVFSTIKDAFHQALSAFIGQVAKSSNSQVVATQKGEMEKLGKSLLGAVGKAYEPMLEQQIGKPIVLELASPNDPNTENIELPGYLAEYSDKYLAVFNIEQQVAQTIEILAAESIERDGLSIEVTENHVTITNKSEIPLVVDALISDNGETRDLGIVLTNASDARLPRIPGELSIRVLRVQKIDVVCPRGQAIVRYASLDHMSETTSSHLPPAHEDRKVWFP